MEKLKRKRAPLRASFTKTGNLLKTELAKDSLDKGVISDLYVKIENIVEELKVLDTGIIDILIDDEKSNEDVILKEMEENEKYSDEFITIKRKVNEALNVNKVSNTPVPSSVDAVNSDSKLKRYKLPKLNIKPFDSQLINYLPFWAQFNKIHEDKELDDCDKFQYLLQAVEPGTRARRLLESYPITSENYSKAVKAFQERYGDKDILIEVYVREFLKLITANVQAKGRDRLALCDLFTKVEAHLRSLESMGIDVESNSAWLYPMIESCLPDDILRAWQRYNIKEDLDSSGSDVSETKSNLNLLMNFLKREVASEERLQLARSGFVSVTPIDKVKEKIQKRDNKYPTAAGLFAAKEMCLFCGKPHESKDCVTARSLSLEEKIHKVKDKNCCLKCLRFGHRAKMCKIFVRCHVCSKPHTELFCPEIDKRKETINKSKPPVNVQNTLANQQSVKEIALMTLQVIVKGPKKSKRVRALLDSGSQKSYILKSTAKELGLKPLCTETITHTVFGGTVTEAKPHSKFEVKLSTPGNDRKSNFTAQFLDQEKICGKIPRIPKGSLFKVLKENRLWVSDVGPGSEEIEILIGSDVYGQLLTGRIRYLNKGLTAIQTKLGWTICGQFENLPQGSLSSEAAMLITNLSLREMSVPDLWRLETIGINDPAQTLSLREEEEIAHDMFLKDLTRNEDGRYCVGLPWTCMNSNIPSNRNEAERRLFSTTRRLKKLNKFEDYDLVFRDWLKEGVIEEVPEERLEIKGHFLPHHPVFKQDSQTTKIRPVFDASCKTDRNPCLNDCLFKGPNFIEQIPAVLLRFRENPIAVVSDIRRAFLQIEVKEKDRQFLRFLWWEKANEIKVYQLNRVLFGATCSPFLLSAVIRYHLSQYPEELKSITEKLLKSFYVDNCVTSVTSISELAEFISKSTEIMAEAKMDLRLWQFGPVEEIEKLPREIRNMLEQNLTNPVSVLGIRWDRKEDCLMICNKFDIEIENPSKRQILSITQGIYDPIGFLAPTLLPAKLMIQEAWSTKSEWDSPLPEKIQNKFQKWYSELKQLANLKINRRIGYGHKENWSIHVFCDASQIAYATVIYLRCEDERNVSVQLLGAKSRLSPLKKTTIPRLELLACVLGARLSVYILEALALSDIPVYYWTDSSTALAWIQRNDEWGTFVGNRVREICKLTDPCRWFFVPGEMNAADLPSRGCSPRHLLESRWWEGEEWLYKDAMYWPAITGQTDEEMVTRERKKGSSLTSLAVDAETSKWYCKYSQFSKIVRILGWIFRFIDNAKKQGGMQEKGKLTLSEVTNAEKRIIKIIQNEVLTEEYIKGLKSLNIFRDEEGVFRVKSKLTEKNDTRDFRFPVILPGKHRLVELLIRETHLKMMHAGLQILLAGLREKFWIVNGRKAVRSVINGCMRCKRYSAKCVDTEPVSLPSDRIEEEVSVFEIIGVDLAGPLNLKEGGKAWIVLYTCAVYRAIHLELILSLSTKAFLLSLRRFIARRGRPKIIYSDNGKNFIGSENMFQSLDWETIESEASNSYRIKWNFIPPSAPWWGGFWERMVQMVKRILRRVLGNASVYYEEMNSILCDCESVINSRPLTYLSEDPEDLIPLTPAMFLQNNPAVGVPDLDHLDRININKRWQYQQTLRENLRKRFRLEYLGTLNQPRKKGNYYNLKVGDVVLIESDSKRILWPMAKVVEIYPGKDGNIRVARLKTSSGEIIRPAKRIYPLEISSCSSNAAGSQCELRRICNQNKTTRSGRTIRLPARFRDT